MEPNVKLIHNEFLSLTQRDWLRGLFMAIGSSVTTYLTTSLTEGGSFEVIKWKQILLVSAITTSTYLLKNLFTPSNTTVEIKSDKVKTNVEGQIPAPAQIVVDMKPGEKPTVTTSVG